MISSTRDMHSNEMKFVPFFVAVLCILACAFSDTTVSGVGFDNGKSCELTEESKKDYSAISHTVKAKADDGETWTKERLDLLKFIMLRECVNPKAANVFECWYLKYLKERDKQKRATTNTGSSSAQFETQRLTGGSSKNILSEDKEANESTADKENDANSSQRNPASSLHQPRSDNAEIDNVFKQDLEGNQTQETFVRYNATSFVEEMDNSNISSSGNRLIADDKDAITTTFSITSEREANASKLAGVSKFAIAGKSSARLEDNAMMNDLDVEERKIVHNFSGIIIGSLAGFLVAVIIIAVVICNTLDKNKYLAPPQEDKLYLFA